MSAALRAFRLLDGETNRFPIEGGGNEERNPLDYQWRAGGDLRDHQLRR